MTPAGLEPAIPGSVGRCLIHWAKGPGAFKYTIFRHVVGQPMSPSFDKLFPRRAVVQVTCDASARDGHRELSHLQRKNSSAIVTNNDTSQAGD